MQKHEKLPLQKTPQNLAFTKILQKKLGKRAHPCDYQIFMNMKQYEIHICTLFI